MVTCLLPKEEADCTGVSPSLTHRHVGDTGPRGARGWEVIDVVERKALARGHEPQRGAVPFQCGEREDT
jgi:hypothetical protein